ncbi:hypothetical protein D0S45_17460 [Marinifilum sp. JC120]|nr:hypothetical protein D0S45_17460 [Marinifilum sp. JC120]
MSDGKHFLQSRTIWGVIVTAIALVASLAGKEIDGETQRQLLELGVAAGGLVGMGLGIYGRFKAEKPIKKVKSNSSTLLVLLAMPVLLQGCALMNLSPQDQALSVGKEMKIHYMALHREYESLHETLAPEQVSFMEEEVAPVMDKAKAAIIAYRSAASTFARYKTAPNDIEDLKNSAWKAINDAVALLGKARIVEPLPTNSTKEGE